MLLQPCAVRQDLVAVAAVNLDLDGVLNLERGAEAAQLEAGGVGIAGEAAAQALEEHPAGEGVSLLADAARQADVGGAVLGDESGLVQFESEGADRQVQVLLLQDRTRDRPAIPACVDERQFEGLAVLGLDVHRRGLGVGLSADQDVAEHLDRLPGVDLWLLQRRQRHAEPGADDVDFREPDVDVQDGQAIGARRRRLARDADPHQVAVDQAQAEVPVVVLAVAERQGDPGFQAHAVDQRRAFRRRVEIELVEEQRRRIAERKLDRRVVETQVVFKRFPRRQRPAQTDRAMLRQRWEEDRRDDHVLDHEFGVRANVRGLADLGEVAIGGREVELHAAEAEPAAVEEEQVGIEVPDDPVVQLVRASGRGDQHHLVDRAHRHAHQPARPDRNREVRLEPQVAGRFEGQREVAGDDGRIGGVRQHDLGVRPALGLVGMGAEKIRRDQHVEGQGVDLQRHRPVAGQRTAEVARPVEGGTEHEPHRGEQPAHQLGVRRGRAGDDLERCGEGHVPVGPEICRCVVQFDRAVDLGEQAVDGRRRRPGGVDQLLGPARPEVRKQVGELHVTTLLDGSRIASKMASTWVPAAASSRACPTLAMKPTPPPLAVKAPWMSKSVWNGCAL